MATKTSPQQILTALTQAASELPAGTALTGAAYNTWRKANPGSPSVHTAIRAYQTWGNAVNQAGQTAGRNGRTVSTEEAATNTAADRTQAVNALRQAAQNQSLPLTTNAYETWRTVNPDNPASTTIAERFDNSWTQATNTADVGPSQAANALHVAIHDAASELGQPLTASEYIEWANTHNKPDLPTRTNLTQWVDLCEQAGIRPGQPDRRAYSRRELVQHLRTAQTAGITSSGQYQTWAKANHSPSRGVIHREFGTWANAQTQANTRPNS